MDPHPQPTSRTISSSRTTPSARRVAPSPWRRARTTGWVPRVGGATGEGGDRRSFESGGGRFQSNGLERPEGSGTGPPEHGDQRAGQGGEPSLQSSHRSHGSCNRYTAGMNMPRPRSLAKYTLLPSAPQVGWLSFRCCNSRVAPVPSTGRGSRSRPTHRSVGRRRGARRPVNSAARAHRRGRSRADGLSVRHVELRKGAQRPSRSQAKATRAPSGDRAGRRLLRPWVGARGRAPGHRTDTSAHRTRLPRGSRQSRRPAAGSSDSGGVQSVACPARPGRCAIRPCAAISMSSGRPRRRRGRIGDHRLGRRPARCRGDGYCSQPSSPTRSTPGRFRRRSVTRL